jgi:hypothetical protein
MEELSNKLSPEDGAAAMPWTAMPTRPAISHRPFLMSLNDKPLVVPIYITPAAAVTRIKLHYRMLSFPGEFKTIETSPRTPAFTIPQADLRVEGTLLYYFEVQHADGHWLYPDPSLSMPVFITTIKNPPPLKEERASRE